MAANKLHRIAVMTSGGDAPGMNACVRAVVRTALFHDVQVYGIYRAYAGLAAGNIEPLGARNVGGIIQKGGTVLQTARLPEFSQPEIQQKSLENLRAWDIDALVVIGGDGSLRGAMALHQLGFPVVGVPASIDNDIWGTNMAIGVDTALNTILEAIDALRDTASSHQRAFLLETMGRHNGYLALMGGITGGAEVILIPEVDIPLEDIAERVRQAYIRRKTHAIIVNAEGSGHSTTEIADYLNAQRTAQGTGFEVRVTILGHVQRGGRPSAFDRLLATRLGNAAVVQLLQGNSGIMVGLQGRSISSVPIEDVVTHDRKLNLDYYEMGRMLAL
jgi:6-phosphofructokinase 1